jgi:hypothetical protein
MSKLISVVAVAMFLLSVSDRGRQEFAKYRAVEAYEIRPGILMMPRYSSDGQVCEIGLEKLHFSPVAIRLDSSLSRKEIDEVFEELAPSSERGPKPANPISQGSTFISGRGMDTNEEYQNVSIDIFGSYSPTDGKGGATGEEVAATLKWKNRKCQ